MEGSKEGKSLGFVVQNLVDHQAMILEIEVGPTVEAVVRPEAYQQKVEVKEDTNDLFHAI